MLGKSFPLPIRKFHERIGIPQKANCPHCNDTSTARLCPACHSELPHTLGLYSDFIFGIIGAKETGKSHYISVLINELKNDCGRDFNCVLAASNEKTLSRYQEDFYRHVFQEKIVIQATRAARANASVRQPLIYNLSFMSKGLLGKTKIHDVVGTTFFDTAGEDLNSEDTMRTENKYIYNSSGIVILLDPLQLDHVRDLLKGKVELPAQNAEITDIVNRTAKLIRLAKGIKLHQQIDIPVAVAFSKCDAIKSLLPADSCLNYPGKHQGYFDLNDFEAVNSEMEALLITWKGDFLVRQLQAGFKQYAFFGLSALGCNPHGAQKSLPYVRPMRVTDPFLWLLWKRGVICARKTSS